MKKRPSSRSPITAWWRICSRRSRKWIKNWPNAAVKRKGNLMSIQRIGVVGAGQMGTGIAHVLSLAGYDVVLDDLNKDALSKALEKIERNMHRQAARGLIKEDQVTA